MNYFQKREFACPCCGKDDIDPDFVLRLNEARGYARVPFIITSGVRCEKHNKEVGSTSRNHIEGKAADIACTEGWKRLRIVRGLLQAGFKRIGIGKTFIHADTMDLPASIWVY